MFSLSDGMVNTRPVRLHRGRGNNVARQRCSTLARTGSKQYDLLISSHPLSAALSLHYFPDHDVGLVRFTAVCRTS
jgi:hypothetical protein